LPAGQTGTAKAPKAGAGRRVENIAVDPLDREEGKQMKVVVDFDLCEENAVCMGLCSQVFDVQDDGLHVLQDEPPDELRTKVEEAEQSCPTQAITIED
jgi:ferredoxin